MDGLANESMIIFLIFCQIDKRTVLSINLHLFYYLEGLKNLLDFLSIAFLL